MARFDLTEHAQADVKALAAHSTQRWGEARTRSYLDALEARLAQLAERPLPGRKRPELGDGLLSFPFESHVIFYLRAAFGIMVLRLLHKRQDPHRHID